jgi:hypothetical protein
VLKVCRILFLIEKELRSVFEHKLIPMGGTLVLKAELWPLRVKLAPKDEVGTLG